MGKRAAAISITAAALLVTSISGGITPAGAAVRVIMPEKMRSWFSGDGFEMGYAWISSDDTSKAYF